MYMGAPKWPGQNMGGPEMAPQSPRLGAPRPSRGAPRCAPRYSDRLSFESGEGSMAIVAGQAGHDLVGQRHRARLLLGPL
jgi:hypothetical protein